MLFTVRMLLLGVHFVVASFLGLLVGICRPFNPDNSRLCAGLYGIPALKILGLQVHTDVKALLEHQRPAVVVANHISNHDLFVFGSYLSARTVSLGKKSLKWVPLFGQVYWLAGNVLIDRGKANKTQQTIKAVSDALLKKDMSIWVFAEGTRGHGKGLGRFKKGAFQMAIDSGVPIVCVCANNYVRNMHLNQWHSGKVMLRALPPISTQGMTQDDVPALMAACHAQMQACIEQLDAQCGTQVQG